MSARATRGWAAMVVLALAAASIGAAPAITPAAADVNEAPGAQPTFAQLSAGLVRSCAVLTDGRVKCWGGGTTGGLGLGDLADRGDGANEMGDNLPAVDLGSGRIATAVSAGSNHTCALLDDATVKCWGIGGRLGQGDLLTRGDGPGDMGDALPPIALGTGRTATAVGAGDQMTCAVLDNASVKCWGLNSNGELGLGDAAARGDGTNEMGDNLATVSLGAGRTAEALAVGGAHACALLDNATVKCWGNNNAGQLGAGTTASRGDGPGEMGDAMAAVSLGAGRTAVALSAGTDHTCAVLDNATLKCWGDNAAGELGQGDTADRGDAAGEMGNSLPTVNVGNGRTVTAVSAGNNTTCVTLDNASVKCWGHNTNGGLGLGDNVTRGDNAGEMGDSLPAVDLGAGRSASAIAAGGTHACALLDDATYKCWGDNGDGDLGLGDTNTRGDSAGQMGDNLPAVDLGQPRAVTAVTNGTGHACAILAGGSVKCWGSGPSLGIGVADLRGDKSGEMGADLPTVNLGNGRTAVAIAAGGAHTCAILDTGAVKCWGMNAFGQLGLGDTAARGDGPGEMGGNLPTVNLGAGRTAVAIDGGTNHTCAVLDNATVKCWGDGTAGKLGLGDTANRGDGPGEMAGNLPAVSLGASRTAVDVTAAANHTCVLMDNAKVKCWGLNSAGQLGLGDTATRGDAAGEMGAALPALDLGTGRTVTTLAAGGSSTCAILDDAALKCWGTNTSGQLGQGDTTSRGGAAGQMGNNLLPVSLGTSRTAVDVAVGLADVCADLDDGSMKCWGSNIVGQGGQGDTVARGNGPGEMGDALPTVDLGAAHSPTALTSLSNSFCALLETATVKCWGLNASGELGLGNQSDRGNDPGEMGDDLPFVQLSGPGDGTISGTITDAVSAAAVTGAFVAVMRVSDFVLVGGATADAGGNYSVDVDPGAYFLYLIDPSGTHDDGFAGLPTRVTVLDGETSDTDATMAPRQGSISGTVTRNGGAPAIAGAWALSSSTTTGAPERGAVALGSGQYTITGLAEGDHSVVYVDPTGNHAPEYLGDSPGFPGTVATVTGGGTATANPTLPTQTPIAGGATLTGTVTRSGPGTPLSGIWVLALRASDFKFARGALTNAGGVYSLDVVAGQYKLAIIDPFAAHDMEWFNDQPFSGLATATNVTSPSVNNVALTRTQGGFSGTVTEQGSGDPLPGVWVVAIDATGALLGGRTTDASGNYAFSTLPVGAYRTVFIDPSGTHTLEYWDNSPDFAGGDDINVTPNSNLDVDAALSAT